MKSTQARTGTIGQLLAHLPNFEPCVALSSSEEYGAVHIAAKYCGIEANGLQISGHWQQNWKPRGEPETPSLVAGDRFGDPSDRKKSFLVARKDEERYLRDLGYPNPMAVGLPICYLEKSRVERVLGSLLVMPAHSLPDTGSESDSEAYADAIDGIRARFEAVVVCLHPACYSRGYWVSAFKRRGYPIIPGIGWNDRNALTRLQTLMEGFDHVTTNGFGSHWAYAAYFGAKLSVYGPYAELRREDYLHAERNHHLPDDLKLGCRIASESTNRERFSFLFSEPHLTSSIEPWGREQVGAENRVSPAELQRLLGWTSLGVAKSKARWFVSKVKNRLNNELLTRVKLAQEPQERDVGNIVKAAVDSPEFAAVEATVSGKRMLFKDRWSLDFLYREIWQKEIYKFRAATECPLVVDCGANVGMAVLYFKNLYPKARIIAFEPDPVLFRILEENARRLGWQDVELREEGVWNTDGEVAFKRHYNLAGRLLPSSDSDGEDTIHVRTKRLRMLLERESVDFLKIDIEGAETEVLEDCAMSLGKVRHMFFEYHSFVDKPQTLHRLLEIANTAGFRVHVHAHESMPHPLFLTQLRGDDFAEMNLDVFCYRV